MYRTRANTVLSGTISDYLLESNINTEDGMDEVIDERGDDVSNTSRIVNSNASREDMQNLISIMAKTLSAITEKGERNEVKSNRLEECPVKQKCTSLDAWTEEVLLWNKSNSCKEDGFNAKKYINFIESVRKSEECSELQNFIQVEFVENATFDKKSDKVISDMISKIKKDLGQSDLEKCSDAWLKFI